MSSGDAPAGYLVPDAHARLPERQPRAGTLAMLAVGQHLLFVVLLVLGAIRCATTGGRPGLVAAATVGTLLWYLAGALLARAGQPRSGIAARLWFVGLLLCWGGLLVLGPDFSWTAFALFLLAVHLLPLAWSLPLVAAMTGIVIAVQLRATSGDISSAVVGPVIGALVAVGFARTVQSLQAEAVERRRLVAELLSAQDDLLAVHDDLAATQRQAGVLAERARLARDIHDTLAQGFSSILLLARAGLAGSESTTMLRQIEVTAADSLVDARRVVHALAPAELEQAPLSAALARVLERLTAHTDIHAELDIDGTARPLPTQVDVALVRLAQGALANTRRHAQARHVRVSLAYAPDSVTLDIVDDGLGFDPTRLDAPGLGGGFGLRAMRERLADLGGTLSVESSPGAGTALAAIVPLGPTGPADDADEESVPPGPLGPTGDAERESGG